MSKMKELSCELVDFPVADEKELEERGIKKIECKVCGHKFIPMATRRYTAVRNDTTTVFGTSRLNDCFDCEICGCQIVAGARLPVASEDGEEL